MWWTYPKSAVVRMPCLNLLYAPVYLLYSAPAASRHCLTCYQEATPPDQWPTSYHVSCLPLLSCMSLLYICGLGLWSFKCLFCDLLPRGRQGLSPIETHCWKSISFHKRAAWRAPLGILGAFPTWGGGHHSLGATFPKGDLIVTVATCQPDDACQPTNIVICFCPAGPGWAFSSRLGLRQQKRESIEITSTEALLSNDFGWNREKSFQLRGVSCEILML